MMICAAIAVVCLLLTEVVVGHGMVHDPVNRATRWRYDRRAPADYDDNQLFCGGFAVSLRSIFMMICDVKFNGTIRNDLNTNCMRTEMIGCR